MGLLTLDTKTNTDIAVDSLSLLPARPLWRILGDSVSLSDDLVPVDVFLVRSRTQP